MNESRKGTIRAAGHIWHYDGEYWSTDLNDRVSVITWKFGSIHQCKVFVKYNGDRVGIGLQCQPTMQAAMAHGVEWAKNYIDNGAQSVEQVFADCYAHWPTLYKTRISVIAHLFFVIGNGYDWLDGAIVSNGPEDYIEAQQRREYRKANPNDLDKRIDEMYRKLIADPKVSDKLKTEYKELLGEESVQERPLPDDGELKVFYPVSNEYSNITLVPDDVRPDWLALAYEAAKLLRDRSGISEACRMKLTEQAQGAAKVAEMVYAKLGKQSKKVRDPVEDDELRCASNIKIGTRIVNELEGRFPQLKA